MMSMRDAMGSYRRQYRRVFGRKGRGALDGATPELRELCRRGDRVLSVWHDDLRRGRSCVMTLAEVFELYTLADFERIEESSDVRRARGPR